MTAVVDAIDAIVRSWQVTDAESLAPPATDAELREAERLLGRPLPAEVVAFYRRCNGASACEGSLSVYPLDGDDLSLVRAATFLRECEWPIPDDLVVFGSDGGEGTFGLWLPRAGGARPVVVETSEIFEAGCFAVVGTSFAAFLRGRTAVLAGAEGDTATLYALGVPAALQRGDDLGALLRWADPTLPASCELDPYVARLTADDVRRFAAMAG